MTFFDPQNPGIGGLDELTDAEALTIQNISGLGDPNADRILFWDDSANGYRFLTAGTGLTITGTTLTASGGSGTLADVSTASTDATKSTYTMTSGVTVNFKNHLGNSLFNIQETDGVINIGELNLPGFDQVNIATSLGVYNPSDSENNYIEITPNSVYMQTLGDLPQYAWNVIGDSGNAGIGANFTNNSNIDGSRVEFLFQAGTTGAMGSWFWDIMGPNETTYKPGSFDIINATPATHGNGAVFVIDRTDMMFLVGQGGNVGIGLYSSNPTARLHLAAGTATASTAPFKFTSGTSLTVPEAGAIEFDGSNYYFTI